MMVNRLKEFFSIIRNSLINFINPVNSINPISQPPYYEFNL